ncbi:MAG: hypothetical protein SCK28_11510 [Bacillota bacterium]|nr:hypothetical protein [Bacillota bacterium]
MPIDTDFMIVVGGVCGSGKSTLIEGLKKNGFHAHSVAQEHSNAPKMYLMTKPDYVILLDCNYDTVQERRNVGWTRQQLQDQLYRLRHMREHCNLFINTEKCTVDEVLAKAISAINRFKERGETNGCNT